MLFGCSDVDVVIGKGQGSPSGWASHGRASGALLSLQTEQG